MACLEDHHAAGQVADGAALAAMPVRRYAGRTPSSRTPIGHFSWKLPVDLPRRAMQRRGHVLERGLAYRPDRRQRGRRVGWRQFVANLSHPSQRHGRRSRCGHGHAGSDARRSPAVTRIRLSARRWLSAVRLACSTAQALPNTLLQPPPTVARRPSRRQAGQGMLMPFDDERSCGTGMVMLACSLL